MFSDDPGNEAKLKIYGLFKQANVGPCNAKKPSSFNMVAKFKYEAWNGLGTMSKVSNANQASLFQFPFQTLSKCLSGRELSLNEHNILPPLLEEI